MLSRRQLIYTVAACLVVPFLIWQFVSLSELYELPGPRLWPSAECLIAPEAPKIDALSVPQKRHHVAIASNFGYHHDVYLAVAWTLERVMNRQDGRSMQVYAPVPFNFGFQDIVDTLQLYSGRVKSPSALIDDINRNKGEGAIDLVVLGTCEVDLQNAWARDLLAAWDARDSDHKFMLVCVVHNILDVDWQVGITDWSRRGAIRLLPISEHVAATFRDSFLANADILDAEIRSAGYEHIPVDVHIPVLDLPKMINPKQSRILSNAVIQGTFALDRRDYLEFFAELKESLARDPKVWGYLPQEVENASYVVDTSLEDPPFRLFIVGSGDLNIPRELQNLIIVRKGLNYSDFYALMREMDICVPAFAPGGGYYDVQASSTIAMAVECDVPILVTEHIKRSYTYIDDPRAVVTRPAAMREVEALRALRSGDAAYFLDRMGIAMDSPTGHAAEAMMRLGWTRSEEESRSFKQDIWNANDRVVERLLRDL